LEALLRLHFPEDLADEIVEDDSGSPTGVEALVAAARKIAKDGPTAVSEAFAAIAADHADPVKLDELRYAQRGAERALGVAGIGRPPAPGAQSRVGRFGVQLRHAASTIAAPAKPPPPQPSATDRRGSRPPAALSRS